MPQPDKCPFCGSENLWSGNIEDGGDSASYIALDDVPISFWKPFANGGIFFHELVEMCLSCGQFWGSLNVREASDFVIRHGSDEVKSKLLNRLKVDLAKDQNL